MPIRLLAVALALLVPPEPVSRVYDRVSRSLARDGIVRAEGWVFSAATWRNPGTSPQASEVAVAAAREAANAAFLPLVLDIDRGRPDCVKGELLEACRRAAAASVQLRLSISGLTQAAEEPGANSARCVQALPETSLPPTPLPWADAWQWIQDSARSISDLALLAEVEACMGDPGQAERRFDDRCAKSIGLATALRAMPIRDGWYRLPSPLSPSRLAGLSDRDAADLLVRRPWDATVTECLANSLQERGYGHAAACVRRWPRLAWANVPTADGEIDRHEGRSKDAEQVRRTGILRVLVHVGIGWPGSSGPCNAPAARESFDLNRLDEALSGYLDEAAINPTADAMNMLAACTLAKGMPACALELATIATTWDPTHPDAAANRMLSLQALGRSGDAVKVARQILAASTCSEWARAKASRLASTDGLPR